MYSAFFLSVDFYTIFIIMNVCMVLLYAGLGYVYARNCIENYHNCSQYLQTMEDDQQNIMRDSLVVKKNMLL